MRINTKLHLTNIICIVVVCLLGITLITVNQVTKERIRAYEQAKALQASIFNLNIITYEYLMHRETRMKQQWQMEYSSISQLIEQLTDNRLRHRIAKDHTRTGNLFDKIITNKKKTTKELELQRKADQRLITALLINSRSIKRKADLLAELAYSAIIELKENEIYIFITLIIALAISVTAISITVERNISTPLKHLFDGIDKVNNGTLQIEIPVTKHNELGELTQTFNRMLKSLFDLQNNMETVIAQRSQSLEDTQKELLNAKKLATIGQISSSITHEINQPLGTAMLKLKHLERSLDKEDVHAAALHADKILTQLKRIDLVISQLGTAGQMAVHKHLEPQRLNELLNNALDTLDESFTEYAIQLNTHFCAQSLMVNADKIELERVFINILANAIDALKHQPDERHIEIQITAAPSQAIIQVTDNGVGIDSSIIDHIFDPFFTTKEAGQGTGLGLAMCYGIINSLGGSIEVQSTVGEGSTFTINMPTV